MQIEEQNQVMKIDWVNIWGSFKKWTIIAASKLAKIKRCHFFNSLMERS